MSFFDKIFAFNPFARFFKASRTNDEQFEKEQVQNSVGVSQEQLDLYNYINYDYLASPGSAVTYIGISFEQYFANKHGRIQKYKEMSLFPEISDSLDIICDEAIVQNANSDICTLEIVKEMPEHIKEEIQKIWNYLILDVFAFNERAWDLFRKWLIESELYIELILNDEGNNIIGIKVLPAHTMMPVFDENRIGGYIQTKIGNPNAQDVRLQQQGSIMFDKDQIAYVNYGLYGANMIDVRGYLESAIRTYNQLKNLEDSIVIYRIVRAPERRVWNVATGRMPKGKAEEYLKGLIQRYRKKIIYNSDTGEIDSTANIQALTEDIWFTRNENGEGTTVETIGGGMQLGELNDINYFLQKLYKTLKLPRSRWEDPSTAMYSSGKTGEILREEIRLSRFIERLQNRFKYILINPFLTLLKLRGIDERYINVDYYNVKFTRSNLFKEYKELELIESRMGILGQISTFIYDKNSNPSGMFSKEFVMKKFFMMTDSDFDENEKLKKKEESQSKSVSPEESVLPTVGFGETPTGETGGEFGTETEAGAETVGATSPAESESVITNNKNLILETWKQQDRKIQKRYKKKNI